MNHRFFVLLPTWPTDRFGDFDQSGRFFIARGGNGSCADEIFASHLYVVTDEVPEVIRVPVK
jgi:hypothetical protein